MDRKILSEIHRISEIMGIKKNIILEASTPIGPGEKAAETFWKNIRKVFGGAEKSAEEITEKELDSVMNRLRKEVPASTIKELEDIVAVKVGERALSAAEKETRIIQKLATNKILEQAIIDGIKVTEEGKKLVEQSIKEFFTNKDVTSQLNDMLEVALERSPTEEAAKKYFRDIWVNEIGAERIDTYLKNVKIENKGGKWLVKYETGADDVILDNINPDELSTEMGSGPGLEDLSSMQAIRASTGGGLPTIFSSVLRSMNNSNVRTLLSVWGKVRKRADTLQAEFNVQAERMAERIRKGERYDSELEKMKNIMIAAKKWWTDMPVALWSKWLETLPQEVKLILNDPRIKTGTEFREFYKKLLEQKEWVEPLTTEMAAFKKMWAFRMPGGKTPGWFIFKKPQPDLGKRITNLILLKDPRTFEEMVDALITNGVKQDIARTVVAKILTETLFGPLYLALLSQTVRPLSAGAEAFYNWANDFFDGTDLNWINYNEPDPTTGKREMNPAKIFMNDFNQVLNELLPSGWGEAIKRIIDPTWLDEFTQNVVFPYINLPGKVEEWKAQSDLINKIKSFSDRKSKEFQDWYNSLDEKTKKYVDAVWDRIKHAVSKYSNTEAGFKAWCVDSGKNYQDWSGSTSTGYVGITTDKAIWKWDDKLNSFLPVVTDTPTPSPEETSNEITIEEILKEKYCLGTGGWKVQKVVDSANPYGYFISSGPKSQAEPNNIVTVRLKVTKNNGTVDVKYDNGSEITCPPKQ